MEVSLEKDASVASCGGGPESCSHRYTGNRVVEVPWDRSKDTYGAQTPATIESSRLHNLGGITRPETTADRACDGRQIMRHLSVIELHGTCHCSIPTELLLPMRCSRPSEP